MNGTFIKTYQAFLKEDGTIDEERVKQYVTTISDWEPITPEELPEQSTFQRTHKFWVTEDRSKTWAHYDASETFDKNYDFYQDESIYSILTWKKDGKINYTAFVMQGTEVEDYYFCKGDYKANPYQCATANNLVTKENSEQIKTLLPTAEFAGNKINQYKDPLATTWNAESFISDAVEKVYSSGMDYDYEFTETTIASTFAIQPVGESGSTISQEVWGNYYWNGENFDLATTEEMPTILYFSTMSGDYKSYFYITNTWSVYSSTSTKLDDIKQSLLQNSTDLNYVLNNEKMPFTAVFNDYDNRVGYFTLTSEQFTVGPTFSAPFSYTYIDGEKNEQTYSMDIKGTLATNGTGSLVPAAITSLKITTDEDVDSLVLIYTCNESGIYSDDDDYRKLCTPADSGHIAIFVENKTDLVLSNVNGVRFEDIESLEILPHKEYSITYNLSEPYFITDSLPTKYKLGEEIKMPTTILQKNDGSYESVSQWGVDLGEGSSRLFETKKGVKNRGNVTLKDFGASDFNDGTVTISLSVQVKNKGSNPNAISELKVNPLGNRSTLDVETDENGVAYVTIPNADGILLSVKAPAAEGYAITSASYDSKELSIVDNAIDDTIAYTEGVDEISVTTFANTIGWGMDYIPEISATINENGKITSVTYYNEKWEKTTETDPTKFAEVLPPKYGFDNYNRIRYWDYGGWNAAMTEWIDVQWEDYDPSQVYESAFYNERILDYNLTPYAGKSGISFDNGATSLVYEDKMEAAGIVVPSEGHYAIDLENYDKADSSTYNLPYVYFKDVDGKFYKTNSWRFTANIINSTTGEIKEKGTTSPVTTTYEGFMSYAISNVEFTDEEGNLEALTNNFAAQALTDAPYRQDDNLVVEIMSPNILTEDIAKGLQYSIYNNEVSLQVSVTDLKTNLFKSTDFTIIAEDPVGFKISLGYKTYSNGVLKSVGAQTSAAPYAAANVVIPVDTTIDKIEIYEISGTITFSLDPDDFAKSIEAYINPDGTLFSATKFTGCYTPSAEDGETPEEICPEPETIALTDLPKPVDLTEEKEFLYWISEDEDEDGNRYGWPGYKATSTYISRTYVLSEDPLSLSYAYYAKSTETTYSQKLIGWRNETTGNYQNTFAKTGFYNSNPIVDENLPTLFFSLPENDYVFKKTSSWDVSIIIDDETPIVSTAPVTTLDELEEFLLANLKYSPNNIQVSLTAQTNSADAEDYNMYVDVKSDIAGKFTVRGYIKEYGNVYSDTTFGSATRLSFPKLDSLEFEWHTIDEGDKEPSSLVFKAIDFENNVSSKGTIYVNSPLKVILENDVVEFQIYEGTFYKIEFVDIYNSPIYTATTDVVPNYGKEAVIDYAMSAEFAEFDDFYNPIYEWTKIPVSTLPSQKYTKVGENYVFWYTQLKEPTTSGSTIVVWEDDATTVMVTKDQVFTQGEISYNINKVIYQEPLGAPAERDPGTEINESEWENVYWNGQDFDIFTATNVPTLVYLDDDDGLYKRTSSWTLYAGTSTSTAFDNIEDLRNSFLSNLYYTTSFKLIAYLHDYVESTEYATVTPDIEEYNLPVFVESRDTYLNIVGSIFQDDDFETELFGDFVNIPKLSSFRIFSERDMESFLVTTYGHNETILNSYAVNSGELIELSGNEVSITIQKTTFEIVRDEVSKEEMERIGFIYEIDPEAFPISYSTTQTNAISFPKLASTGACFIGWNLQSEERELIVTLTEKDNFEWMPKDITGAIFATPVFSMDSTCNVVVKLADNSKSGIKWSVLYGEKIELVKTDSSGMQSLELPSLEGLEFRIFAEALDKTEMIEVIKWNDHEIENFFILERLTNNNLTAFTKKNDDGVDTYTIAGVVLNQSASAVRLSFDTEITASKEVELSVQFFRNDTLFLDSIVARDIKSGSHRFDYYPLPAGNYYATITLYGANGIEKFNTASWNIESSFLVNAGQTWQMVSLAAIDSSFDYANSNSTFYYWDEEKPVGEYWQYQRFAFDSEIDSTRGYWFFAEDSVALPLNTAFAKSESDTISWELKNRYSGWNMIANPYSWNVYLGGSEGFGDAESEDEPFWRWNATTAAYEPVDTLEAFAAIWAFAEKDTVLNIASAPVFSTAADSTKAAAKKALTKASSKNSWAIRLVLEGENGMKDAWNVVGVGAREVSIQEPPAGFDGSVNLAIERGNLALAKSIKASSNDATWKLSLQANKLQSAKLHAEGLEKLKELGLKAVLVMDGREMDMHSEEDIDVTLGALAKSAELRVVPTAAIAIAGIQNVRYNVEGSKLHVSFDLDEARGMADVRLIDSDGQVISLAREKAVNGKNSFALSTPKNSGIYFLRITNGKSAKNVRFKF